MISRNLPIVLNTPENFPVRIFYEKICCAVETRLEVCLAVFSDYLLCNFLYISAFISVSGNGYSARAVADTWKYRKAEELHLFAGIII